jgi:hypothetical protein
MTFLAEELKPGWVSGKPLSTVPGNELVANLESREWTCTVAPDIPAQSLYTKMQECRLKRLKRPLVTKLRLRLRDILSWT